MLKAKFADDPRAKFIVYDVIGQKTKDGYLNLTYGLFSRNLNSLYHLYSEKHGEPSNQENIFCSI